MATVVRVYNTRTSRVELKIVDADFILWDDEIIISETQEEEE